jgi:Ser/Thr protein kinase RdoA (MazF antagonist)
MIELSGVLQRFGVSSTNILPLGNTENTNYLVTTPSNERYLLRQHRAASRSLAMLESEMLLLNYLHQSGLEVQRPVPLPAGNFIFSNDAGRFSLLSWIDGEVLETINQTQAQAVGILMARFHRVARDFTPPAGFERPQYDAAYLEHTLTELRLIDWLQPDMALFEQSMALAKQAFEEPNIPKNLIHADLHPGNMVWQGEKVAMIDFDRCGFGPVSYDIATTFGYLEQSERSAFLAGYEQVLPLPEGFRQKRKSFTIAEWLTNLAFLAARAEDRKYVDTIMLPGLREQLVMMLETSKREPGFSS